ncbi:N-alpha-acetyltransferase 80 isoform X2 [Belonocnema kinseyi]|uniref:N-alpha-acetyltransferase 80 isoform X2 n=1 Tax=Belonocnema kinseyi TaxID=2817044 RepID=UPI00143D82C6|nr:N-alpha-acetyltransferase 80 isoform X2 [Belonocnema kinseyi]
MVVLEIYYRAIYSSRSALEIMKDTPYNIIPIHQKPELIDQCCKLLNSEWHRSDKTRLRTLRTSCDKFPTSLVLLDNEKVIGHSKISLIPSIDDCCVIESFVISREYRSQGLGSILLRGVEQYVSKKGIRRVYLSTKDQEGFYRKNGYSVCEPLNLHSFADYINSSIPVNENDNMNVNVIENDKNERNKERIQNVFSGAPPPPPMPNFVEKKRAENMKHIYMMKNL